MSQQALLSALMLFMALPACAGSGASTEGLPNIIMILVDDMGWSDIGSYGGEIQTPNLDSLAEDGLRFTQFHNTSKCFPSRATLLTGLYAQQVDMVAAPASIKNASTLAEVLRGRGYRTLMTGKHHGTDNPFNLGFDHYSGLRDGAANHFNPGKQREGEPPPSQKQKAMRVFCFDEKCHQPWTPEDRNYYSTDAYTQWAIDFLDRYHDEDKPYFLYLSYQAPHDPLQAWPQDIDRYRETYKVGYKAIAAARRNRQLKMELIDESWPEAVPTHREWEALDTQERESESTKMAIYAAMIDRVDQSIGKLLAKIDAIGERDNTLIMFASDNGSSAETSGHQRQGAMGSMSYWASLGGDWANVSNTPFRLFKNYSHQGGIATPFVVRWPEVIREGGSINHTPAHFIDVMATLVDITSASYPAPGSAAVERGEVIPPLMGVSLMPLFNDGSLIERNVPLFWQWQNGRAIRTGNWKLVSKRVRKNKTLQPWELYDMRTDKTETRDLAASHTDLVDELSTQHTDWLKQVSNPPVSNREITK